VYRNELNIVVLSKDVVTITLPTHFTIKAKGASEYNGQYVWSAIIRKENNRWAIFQTHESWLNYAEAMAALTPPPIEEKK
jgi:ketosteroid isomerase-like protein